MRAVWDAQAGTLADAEWAVWAEPDSDQGVAHCLDMICPGLGPLLAGAQVLDLGAGIGRLSIPVARAHPAVTVWALDISASMLTHLAAAADRAQVRNVRTVLGDGHHLTDEIPALDAAWSVVTLQHLPADLQASYVRQVLERLRPGGVFRFQVVTGTERGPLSNPVTGAEVVAWCDGLAGLTLERDPRFPTWRWVTAVRS